MNYKIIVMARKRIEVTKEELEWAIAQTNSVRAASTVLGIAYMTFKRRCVEFGVHKPNQGLKGTNKPNPKWEIPLEKIFNNEQLYDWQRNKAEDVESWFMDRRMF
jgi:hypothetical protein